MHNADDFLIADKDLTLLESVFGNWAIICRHAGNTGNLWYCRNKEDMVGIFLTLLAQDRSNKTGLSASEKP